MVVTIRFSAPCMGFKTRRREYEDSPNQDFEFSTVLSFVILSVTHDHNVPSSAGLVCMTRWYEEIANCLLFNAGNDSI